MPELPEVETLRRDLSPLLSEQTITHVKIFWPKAVAPLTPRQFAARLKNKIIKKVERRAKMLIIHLTDGNFLVIHLKMTGQLIFTPKKGGVIMGGHSGPLGHTRVSFNFKSGARLDFNDLRKFGWMRLMTTEALEKITNNLGPEPLETLTKSAWEKILNRYPQRTLKQVLLDQTLIAGLGNIYVDEACHRAKVRPERRAESITTSEGQSLRRAIMAVLRHSLRHGGTSSRDYRRASGAKGGFHAHLRVYGRGGKPCLKCRRPITKSKHAGRGTHYCAYCQK